MIYREDEAAGFTPSKHMREDNYDHDVRGVQLSSSNIKKDGKKLSKLQEDIRRKSKKKDSKELDQCKQKYGKILQRIVTEVEDIKSVNDLAARQYMHMKHFVASSFVFIGLC